VAVWVLSRDLKELEGEPGSYQSSFYSRRTRDRGLEGSQ
jgi:hypothetical protein